MFSLPYKSIWCSIASLAWKWPRAIQGCWHQWHIDIHYHACARVFRTMWNCGIRTIADCWAASTCRTGWSQKQNQCLDHILKGAYRHETCMKRAWCHHTQLNSISVCVCRKNMRSLTVWFLDPSWSQISAKAQVGDDTMKSGRVALPQITAPTELERRVSGRTGNFAHGSPEEAVHLCRFIAQE